MTGDAPEAAREAAGRGLVLLDVVVGTGGQPITWACAGPSIPGLTPVITGSGWTALRAWHATENRWVVLSVRTQNIVALVPRTWPTSIPLPPQNMLEETPHA